MSGCRGRHWRPSCGRWRVGCRGGFCVPRRGSRCRCPSMRTGRRVACSSRVGSPRRRCARRSSRPSAVSPSRPSTEFCRTRAAVCAGGLRVSRRSARGFCRCASITGWTLPGSCWRRCGRRRPGRAVSFSSCCRPRGGRRARGREARPRGCARAAGFSRVASLRALDGVGLSPWRGARCAHAGLAAPGRAAGGDTGGGPVRAGARAGDRREGRRADAGRDDPRGRVGAESAAGAWAAGWGARGVRPVSRARRAAPRPGTVLRAAARSGVCRLCGHGCC